MDVWKYYVGGQLSRIQRDTNGDGRADRWEFYNEGKLERAGVDVDFDGHVDRWDHDEEARAAAEAKERGSDQGAKTGGGAGSVDAGVALTGDLSKLNTAGDGHGDPQRFGAGRDVVAGTAGAMRSSRARTSAVRRSTFSCRWAISSSAFKLTSYSMSPRTRSLAIWRF